MFFLLERKSLKRCRTDVVFTLGMLGGRLPFGLDERSIERSPADAPSGIGRGTESRSLRRAFTILNQYSFGSLDLFNFGSKLSRGRYSRMALKDMQTRASGHRWRLCFGSLPASAERRHEVRQASSRVNSMTMSDGIDGPLSVVPIFMCDP